MESEKRNLEVLQRINAKAGGHRRTLTINRADINGDSRTIELSFSSEAPVERWYGTEVLDHAATVRMDRIRTQAPLLLNHDPDQQIGVIESADINSGERVGRASVRFSRSGLGEEIFQDVKDGIRGLVSVGYKIHKVEVEQRGEVEFVRVVDWEPLEVSIVSIPADTSVGVGRSDETANLIKKKIICSNDQFNSAPTRQIVLVLPAHLKIAHQ